PARTRRASSGHRRHTRYCRRAGRSSGLRGVRGSSRSKSSTAWKGVSPNSTSARPCIIDRWALKDIHGTGLGTTMKQQRTCRLATLGCKVNQYETQHAKELLEANGYREARAGERADLCLVNTCTVTREADAQGRQLIRRIARENPGTALVVTGCYATREPETVARLPGVVKVVTDKNRLAEELREFGVKRQPSGISRFDGHQRAFVKVQDGCLLNCTFCIIPRVRPVLRSRPVEEICDEVRRLVASGYREIVLTGIHLGHYGIDLSRAKPREQWRRLWHLLDRLGDMPGE